MPHTSLTDKVFWLVAKRKESSRSGTTQETTARKRTETKAATPSLIAH